MPIEPASPRWVLPDLQDISDGQDLVAIGADLSPGMLLAGYRRGLFAMPDPEAGIVGWWSPDPRGILRPTGVHVARSLRRALRRFEVSVDESFADVLAACADPRREHGWISTEYRASYLELHALGWAHSLEVWDADGTLAGGLFGVEVGGLFAAESKFHARTDASKVAVVALSEILAAAGSHRLIDVQWRTDHLASLGVVEVPRATYLRELPALLASPPALAGQVVPDPPPSRIRWRKG